MKEGTEPLDEESFKLGGSGEKPGVAEIGFHEHAVRPHRNRMRKRAHGA
jgi:hypothetical protein